MEKTEDVARMCSACNLFFASASTNYLCSGCFKKTTNSKIQQKTQEVKSPVKQPEVPTGTQQSKPQQQDPSRCFSCKKKVGLLGVNCKCGFIFCNKHRMPQEHQCGVDYRKIGKQELSKGFQSVAPRKLSQI